LKKLVLVSFVVLALGFAAGRLQAQGMPGGPCSADMAKFCKDVKPGGGKKMKCLKEHESDLSDACKKEMSSHEAGAAHAQACKSDAEKFCKDVKPGGGRIKKCLKEHEADLSADCKTAMGK
jgi:hypothetical protein